MPALKFLIGFLVCLSTAKGTIIHGSCEQPEPSLLEPKAAKLESKAPEEKELDLKEAQYAKLLPTIAKLGSDVYREREDAQRELQAILDKGKAEQRVPLLALIGSKKYNESISDPEIRARLRGPNLKHSQFKSEYELASLSSDDVACALEKEIGKDAEKSASALSSLSGEVAKYLEDGIFKTCADQVAKWHELNGKIATQNNKPMYQRQLARLEAEAKLKQNTEKGGMQSPCDYARSFLAESFKAKGYVVDKQRETGLGDALDFKVSKEGGGILDVKLVRPFTPPLSIRRPLEHPAGQRWVPVESDEQHVPPPAQPAPPKPPINLRSEITPPPSEKNDSLPSLTLMVKPSKNPTFTYPDLVPPAIRARYDFSKFPAYTAEGTYFATTVFAEDGKKKAMAPFVVAETRRASPPRSFLEEPANVYARQLRKWQLNKLRPADEDWGHGCNAFVERKTCLPDVKTESNSKLEWLPKDAPYIRVGDLNAPFNVVRISHQSVPVRHKARESGSGVQAHEDL